jgi:hypothetical protein
MLLGDLLLSFLCIIFFYFIPVTDVPHWPILWKMCNCINAPKCNKHFIPMRQRAILHNPDKQGQITLILICKIAVGVVQILAYCKHADVAQGLHTDWGSKNCLIEKSVCSPGGYTRVYSPHSQQRSFVAPGLHTTSNAYLAPPPGATHRGGRGSAFACLQYTDFEYEMDDNYDPSAVLRFYSVCILCCNVFKVSFTCPFIYILQI